MSHLRPEEYHAVAEASWRWVLDQVRWDDGPWIPESVGTSAPSVSDLEYRDGTHNGIGGLAYLLAEIRLSRPWTSQEHDLAQGIAQRLRAQVEKITDYSFFDGLASTIGVLTALGADGSDAAVDRLRSLATPDGWPQPVTGPPRTLPDARLHDVTLGTAGVLLAAVWAARAGVPGADALARQTADIVRADAEPTATGLNWPYIPSRFRPERASEMPNFSHGLAGIAASLAVAGAELHRDDLVDAARRGAEHLVTLADPSTDGFVVPREIPHAGDMDRLTYTWCHGPTGTSLMFLALDHARIDEVAGQHPLTWQRRCLHSVRTSGLPARLHPGFWDNDGRCCGTAGVGEIFLDSWQRAGDDADLGFGLDLADTLVGRAVHDGRYAYWRFVEHRLPEPLLPPGVGWMQGAAGISAFLYRASRVPDRGVDAPTVPRMDTWWTLPQRGRPRDA